MEFDVPDNDSSGGQNFSEVDDLMGSITGDDDDDDALTPADVLAQMTTAWQNELSAPVLLPHRYDLADCILDQISGMEENIRNDRRKDSLKSAIHKMELYRIGFIVNDYIRERLKKIEKNPKRWLSEDDTRRAEDLEELLDPREKNFAKRFFNSTAALIGSCFLDELPPVLRKIPIAEEDDVPNCVFIEVKDEDVGEVAVPDLSDPTAEVLVNLEQHSKHLIPYKSVASLVEENSVLLL